jgi:hypothetical protein
MRSATPGWRTRDEAESAIFTDIDGWYKIGYLSPDEYRRRQFGNACRSSW